MPILYFMKSRNPGGGVVTKFAKMGQKCNFYICSSHFCNLNFSSWKNTGYLLSAHLIFCNVKVIAKRRKLGHRKNHRIYGKYTRTFMLNWVASDSNYWMSFMYTFLYPLQTIYSHSLNIHQQICSTFECQYYSEQHWWCLSSCSPRCIYILSTSTTI